MTSDRNGIMILALAATRTDGGPPRNGEVRNERRMHCAGPGHAPRPAATGRGRADSALRRLTVAGKPFYVLRQRGRFADIAYDHGRLLAREIEQGVFPEILSAIARGTDLGGRLKSGVAAALFRGLSNRIVESVSGEFRDADRCAGRRVSRAPCRMRSSRASRWWMPWSPSNSTTWPTGFKRPAGDAFVAGAPRGGRRGAGPVRARPSGPGGARPARRPARCCRAPTLPTRPPAWCIRTIAPASPAPGSACPEAGPRTGGICMPATWMPTCTTGTLPSDLDFMMNGHLVGNVIGILVDLAVNGIWVVSGA